MPVPPATPAARHYATANVGVSLGDGLTVDPTESARQYAYANVGVSRGDGLTSDQDESARHYAYANVGHRLPTSPHGRQYAYANVTDTTPHPVLWWLQPASGQVGDEFEAVGKGLGATQAAYAGVVKLGTVLLSVVAWDRIPATGAPPAMNEVAQTITVEHERVRVQVPEGATSGLVTVTTDGP